MTLRASPSRALRVSRSRSFAGARPELAGRSAAPPAWTEGRRDFPVSGAHRASGIGWVVGDDSVALPRGVVAPGAGVVGAAEPVVRSVKETPEHDWVRHAGEVPFCIAVAVGGRQRVEGAQRRLVSH
jgi:hypothetical protein